MRDGAHGVVPIAALPEELMANIDADTRIVGISRDTADKQLRSHPEILAEDYAKLADLVERGKVIRVDPRNLAFVGRDEDLPWIAVIKKAVKGNELFLTTFYRASSGRYVARLIERGEVVRK